MIRLLVERRTNEEDVYCVLTLPKNKEEHWAETAEAHLRELLREETKKNKQLRAENKRLRARVRRLTT